MLIVTLATTAKTWDQLKCSLTNKDNVIYVRGLQKLLIALNLASQLYPCIKISHCIHKQTMTYIFFETGS